MNQVEMLKAIGADTWETLEFPQSKCVLEMKNEKGVFESDGYYLCCIVDMRAPEVESAYIRVLKPYCYHETQIGYGLLRGWVDSCGNTYDHKDHDIHNDRERVVAWKSL